MRTVCWTRSATCALVPSIVTSILVSAIVVPATALPASAERRRRSLSDCTSFAQTDAGDDKVAFTIHNACTMPVDCSVSWRVVCAPESRTRRASHPASAKLSIAEGGSQGTEASAAACGDDAWTIDSVAWTCRPNKD